MIKAYRRTSFRYDFIRENHEKEINFSFKFVSQEGKDKKKPHFKGLNLHFEFFNIKKQLFQLGVVEIKNNSGNLIKVYDKEKTVCDIIKNKERIELQIYLEVIQNYFKGHVKLHKLSKYAKELGISNRVTDIVSLMMNP